jgi:hypothetical protein
MSKALEVGWVMIKYDGAVTHFSRKATLGECGARNHLGSFKLEIDPTMLVFVLSSCLNFGHF